MIESSLIGYSRGELGNETFQATNPATGENLITEYCSASEDEVGRACELAKLASLSMAALSGGDKAKFLCWLPGAVSSSRS